MSGRVLALVFFWIPAILTAQESALKKLLSDSSMAHAEVSFCITNAVTDTTIVEYNSGRSLIPASVMKLITSSAALENLGPDYTFRTIIGYRGILNKSTGRLNGDIIIKGGGDPALGSKNFEEHYSGFADKWADEVKKAGIKKIKGRIIADDSYYDYLPIPAKWLWEDARNYYGAGAYGLSVFDNTYEIHFRTSSESSIQVITGIYPAECRFEFSNWLVAAGTSDKGYVFAAPYSTKGWLAGTIPDNMDDFVLKASITDPPLILAKVIDQKLKSAGIVVSGSPTTVRLLLSQPIEDIIPVGEVVSPPLSEIIKALNHESVNMYAEHLVKELGKVFNKKGSTETGIQVIGEFLEKTGIDCSGMFIQDGSGLSPLDAVNSRGICDLLSYMKKKAQYRVDFMKSLPEAGKVGTLKNVFKDPVFDSRLIAKSGSMTRVRSYAGYLTTLSGNDLIFSIIVNNFTGPHQNIISHIEEILKETISNK